MSSAELFGNSHSLTYAKTADHKAGHLLELDAERFRADFNRKPFVIGHHLIGHPLFALPRLIELAKRIPPENLEYNAGDIPVNLDPELTPHTGLSVEETIRRIEDCRSWMALKNVENDPEYRVLLNECLDEIQTQSEPLAPGMRRREGYIFISSPGSVTPYHMDPEYNFLLQIRGRKTINIFDPADRSIVSEQELEKYLTGGHRNMVFKDEYQQKASIFELVPGAGLHFPVTAPHWVRNGDEVSISFSITFRTPASDRRTSIYSFNAWLRSRGLNPAPFGQSSVRDSIKYFAFRAMRRTRKVLSRFRGEAN